MNIDKFRSLVNHFSSSVNDFSQSFRTLSLKDKIVMQVALLVFSVAMFTGISCLLYRRWYYQQHPAKTSPTDDKVQKVAQNQTMTQSSNSQSSLITNSSTTNNPTKTGSGSVKAKRVSFSDLKQEIPPASTSTEQTKVDQSENQNIVEQSASSGMVTSKSQSANPSSIRIKGMCVPIFYQSAVPDGLNELMDQLWQSCKKEFPLVSPTIQYISLSAIPSIEKLTSKTLKGTPYFYSFMFNATEFKNLNNQSIIEEFQKLPKRVLNALAMPFVILVDDSKSLTEDSPLYEKKIQEIAAMANQLINKEIKVVLCPFIYRQSSELQNDETSHNHESFRNLIKLTRPY